MKGRRLGVVAINYGRDWGLGSGAVRKKGGEALAKWVTRVVGTWAGGVRDWSGGGRMADWVLP